MVTKTPESVLRKVEGIVHHALEERFQDGEYVFDPVIAVAKPDFWGDERINVYIVHSGGPEIVDPDFAVRLVRIILDNVTEEEVPDTPFKFFIIKSEWDEVKRTQVDPWILNG